MISSIVSRPALLSSTLVLAVLGWSAALAHSWYPLECCSEKDCHALQEAIGETVLETPDGWELWDGRKIARRTAKSSPDSKFHLCETPARVILCFFAPPGGA